MAFIELGGSISAGPRELFAGNGRENWGQLLKTLIGEFNASHEFRISRPHVGSAH